MARTMFPAMKGQMALIFLMRKKGYKNSEIAVTMKLSKRTVEQTIYLARAKMTEMSTTVDNNRKMKTIKKHGGSKS